jgi:putative DNA primase/helicase
VDNPTDFNDLAQLAGPKAVKACIDAAASPGDLWPEPQPLETKVEMEPYPIDALPDVIRLAVNEVLGFVKAPAPLVISAALSALSMAVQAHADVERAVKLSGPSSLFMLTIAESGERKSTCDGFFTAAIRDYEAAQVEAAKPSMRIYEAGSTAWDAKYSGVKDSIRLAAKNGEPADDKEAELLRLQKEKPEPPRLPKIIYADATPEALKYALAKQWPSGAVVSSEAGIVFGSHGMGKDSAMRNLATLNQLWDGTDMPTERRSSESYTVRGARLTMSLMVQETTLRAFFKQDGGLARGTGFLARFLIAWPESTQGFRPFTEAPENWPHLAEFNRRIATILNQATPIDDGGALMPAMLPLAPEAKNAWVAFHDAIESRLASGGELYDIRDVASKTADNAARLAGLFQVFKHGSGAVGLDAIESASRIAAWHLNEARRFFGGLALPQEMADAARLDSWMIEYCQREKTSIVPVSKIQQYGPSGLRAKLTIEAALEELTELERVRCVKDGKRRTVHVNPALLAGIFMSLSDSTYP